MTGRLAWLLLAAMTAAPFSTASSDLAGLGRDDQVAALTAHGIGGLGVVVFSVLCLAAGAGDTHGRPLCSAAAAGGRGSRALAVVAVVPLLIPFSSPRGTVALMLAAAVLGVTSLIRARSAV